MVLRANPGRYLGRGVLGGRKVQPGAPIFGLQDRDTRAISVMLGKRLSPTMGVKV